MTIASDPRLLRRTLDEVRDALHDLCDVQLRSVWREDGTVTRHKGLSLLDQLRDEVANSSNRGGRRKSSSSSPIGVDALDLWNTIGAGMTMLCEEFNTHPEQPGIEAGLRAVVSAAGASTDLEALLGLRGFLRAWVNSIRTLLDPPKRVPLWGHSCPVEGCGEKTVWRVDESDGELKRAAALEAVLEENQRGDLEVVEIHCLACAEPWPRAKVYFLARLLGCELPGEGLEEGETSSMTLPPEPPIGSEVVDRHDVRWEHVEGTHDNHYWMRADVPDGDPESWLRVNEFGPLRLAWVTADLQSGELREELRPLRWVEPEEFMAGGRPADTP